MSQPGYEHLDTNKRTLFIEYNEEAAEKYGTYSTSDKDIIASYGVKIISYEYHKPIENNYKDKFTFADWDFSIN